MTDNGSCERETSQSPPAHNHSSFKTRPIERAGGGLLQAVARREARDQGGYHARHPQPAPGLRAHSRSLAAGGDPQVARRRVSRRDSVLRDPEAGGRARRLPPPPRPPPPPRGPAAVGPPAGAAAPAPPPTHGSRPPP